MDGYVKSMRKLIGHKPLMVCSASIIVFFNGKILLQLRADNQMWSYHGGAVELGEEVEAAAKRELLEETGLRAEKLTLFGVFSGPEMHMIYPNGDETYVVDNVFICEKFSGDLMAQPEEISDLQWFDLQDMPENITPSVRIPLQHFIENQKQ